MSTTKLTVAVSQADAIRAGVNAPASTVVLQVDIGQYEPLERELVASSIKNGHDLTGELRFSHARFRFSHQPIALIQGTEEEFRTKLRDAAAEIESFKEKFSKWAKGEIYLRLSHLEFRPTDFPFADNFVRPRSELDMEIRAMSPFISADGTSFYLYAEDISDFCRAALGENRNATFLLLAYKDAELDAAGRLREAQRKYIRELPTDLKSLRTTRLMAARCTRGITAEGMHTEEFSFNSAMHFPDEAKWRSIEQVVKLAGLPMNGAERRAPLKHPELTDYAVFRAICIPRESILDALGEGEKATDLIRAIDEENRRRAALAVKAAFSGSKTVSIQTKKAISEMAKSISAFISPILGTALICLLLEQKILTNINLWGFVALILILVQCWLVFVIGANIGPAFFSRKISASSKFLRDRATDCFKDIPDADAYTVQFYPAP